MSSITKDVIARGVYSDAGLELLFAEHIEKNKGRLNLVRFSLCGKGCCVDVV